MQGSAEDAARLVAPLRELGAEFDLFGSMPASAISQFHGDPDGPVPAAGDGMLLRDLPVEAIEAFAEFVASPTGMPLMTVEFRLLGGELAPGRGDAAAVVGADDVPQLR